MTRERWFEAARIGVVGTIVSLYYFRVVPLPFLLVAVAAGLYPLVKTAVVDLYREHRIGTEVFVTLATTIAMIGREYVAGAILLVIILIAEFIAELNTDRARASIKALIGSVPQVALVRRGQTEESIRVEDIGVGEVVVVRTGDRVPVDGIVRSGEGSVDQSPITGESMPQEKAVGDTVLAGTIVDSGALDVETQKPAADTIFARIIQLVEHAEEQKAPVQKLADRVASWLIPVVFVFLLTVFLITRDVRLIVTLLIFTSPAELGLATPLVMIAAIARAARAGILVKGGVFLELLAKVDVIAFDKTGTLTIGQPEVARIRLFDPGTTEEELLRLAAAAERRSSHPIAAAVLRRARSAGLNVSEPAEFAVLQGRGVRAKVEGKSVLVGNAALLGETGLQAPSLEGETSDQTVLFVAADSRVLGAMFFADIIRPQIRATIARLKRAGIKRTVMVTGDHKAVAERIGAEVGVDQVYSDLMPEDKVRVVRELQAQGHRVAMVGDGVNDAPALAAADVGIAMGVAGTQAALEAADVALMTDEVGKILEARAIASRAYRTIQENLIFGVGVVHVAGIVAALLKLIGPIQAALIHLGPDILVFVNSIKLLHIRIPTLADEIEKG